MAKITTPDSLYGNSRDILREAERENEILADIAGEEYESPGDIPKGKYVIEKRLLDAAQKKNELLETIAEEGGGAAQAAKAIGIDYATDVISLKNKDGDVISGSGATLPAYGVSFDSTTGGLTLTKNGTAVQGQTVTIPNYGSPVGVTDSADMVDEGTIYLYEGTTGADFTQGHFYYYDGSAWADGGEYAAATVQTDKTLLVEDRAADAKATGEAVAELKTQLKESTSALDSAVFSNAEPFINWTIGGITSTGGTNSTYKWCIRPYNRAFKAPADGAIGCDDGYDVRIVKYSDYIIGASNFVSDGGWSAEPQKISKGEFIAVQIRNHNDTTTELSDTSISEHLHFDFPISKIDELERRSEEDKKLLWLDKSPDIAWVVGGITSQGVVNSTNKYCIRPDGVAPRAQIDGTIGCDIGYEIRVVKYSDYSMGASTFVSDSGWTAEAQSVTAGEYVAPQIRIAGDNASVYDNTDISAHIVYDMQSPVQVATPYRRNLRAHKADLPGWYATVQAFPEGFDHQTVYKDVIAAFDTLAAGSDGHLTKSYLGGIGSYDSDQNEYGLFEYVFEPFGKHYQSVYDTRLVPMFMLNCTAHGFEKNATYATYYLIKDMLNNWSGNAALTYLRNNVKLRIIPVQNPWGFDYETTAASGDSGGRLNANGVNLNRNYDNPQWESGTPGTSNYGGTEPFSERECQITRDWILKYKDDALAVLDVHTNGRYNATGYGNANPFMPIAGLDDPYYNKLFGAGCDIIEKQTAALSSEITALSGVGESDFIGKIQAHQSTETEGLLSLWATNHGVIGMTEELFNGLNLDESTNLIPKFTSDSFKATTEILGNCLIGLLREFCEG